METEIQIKNLSKKYNDLVAVDSITLDMGMKDIIPEIASLLILTLIYFSIGVLLFRKRHMRIR